MRSSVSHVHAVGLSEAVCFPRHERVAGLCAVWEQGALVLSVMLMLSGCACSESRMGAVMCKDSLATIA